MVRYQVSRLSGSITALATPFSAAGDVDRQAWRQLLQRQMDAGIHGVVVAGSTGEAPALSTDEFSWLLASAVELVDGRIPVIAGTGLSNTAKTIAQTRLAADLGATAALVVTPAYVRPTQAGLEAHFNAVADQGGLPVIAYNVPIRTGCDMLPATVARIAGHPRIVAVKEARSEPERMQALLDLQGDAFAVFSGDDGSALRALRSGADGVISVASNVLPATFRRLCNAVRDGNDQQATELDQRLQPVYAFLGLEPNPIPLKALLQQAGIGHGLRLPLTPLAAEHATDVAGIAAIVEALELFCRDLEAA